MACKYCDKPVVLVPSAEERARTDVTNKSPGYFRSLFPNHSSCYLEARKNNDYEAMMRPNRV